MDNKKQWIKVSNKGEVNPLGLHLLGASVKDDSKKNIGEWGSGLKYSLAALLRNKISFKIFRGKKEIHITTKDVSFGDKTFQIIIIDGKETSFTTNMGVGDNKDDWNRPFSIFREIYSNAIDAGDPKLEVTTTVEGTENETAVYIEYIGDFVDFFVNFDEYFSFKLTPILDIQVDSFPAKNVKVYSKGKDSNIRLFRQGVLAHWIEHKESTETSTSIFNYDLDTLSINESRIAVNVSSSKHLIGVALLGLPLTYFQHYLDELKGGNTGLFEHNAVPYSWDSVKIQPEVKEWLKTITVVGAEHLVMINSEMIKPDTYILPYNLIKVLLKHVPELEVLGVNSNGVGMVAVEPSEVLLNTFLDALNILNNTSFKSKLKDLKYEFVKFSDSGTFGYADKDRDTICLAEKLEDYDVHHIAEIIIEEVIHLKTGYEDLTRSLQSHLIRIYYNELTRKEHATTA